jgi:transposase
MPKPYSVDLRARVIENVESGASRREAAERYGISPGVVVIWVRRFEQTGSVAAKPSGGSISPLEQHAEFLLGLIANQPDLTLDEFAAMRKRRIAGSRSAVWRFFAPATSASKKTLYAAEQKRADVARARRRWMREQGMFDPARLVFIDETCTNTAMVRLRGRAPCGERLVGYAPHGHWKTITFVGGLRNGPAVVELGCWQISCNLKARRAAFGMWRRSSSYCLRESSARAG